MSTVTPATISKPLGSTDYKSQQVFFADIFKDTSDLLNKDFYHSIPLSLDLQTAAANGTKFTLKGKQPIVGGPLVTNLETKVADPKSGLVLTQGWSNDNKLTTKLELDNITPGLNTELNTSFNPGTILSNEEKSLKYQSCNLDCNVKFVQPYFNAKGVFNFQNGPQFTGDVTTCYEGIIIGTQFGYNISKGSIASYAMAMGYCASDYSLGLQVDHKNITSISFNQKVSPLIHLGTRATMNPATEGNSKVNVEFVSKYCPDKTSQVKAKINDSGILTLGFKQLLRPGITLGLGTSFDALKLDEPVHKVGWSLSFDV